MESAGGRRIHEPGAGVSKEECDEMWQPGIQIMSTPMSPAAFPLDRAGALEWTRRGVFAREWDLTRTADKKFRYCRKRDR